jgi:hypothetical protein
MLDQVLPAIAFWEYGIGFPSSRYRERSIVLLDKDLPALNLRLGDTDVTSVNETPREERRVLDVWIDLKSEKASGLEVMEEVEGLAEVIEGHLLYNDLAYSEMFGLDYIERVELAGLSPAMDSEGRRVAGLLTLRFSVTYAWDYPERDHDDFETIAGGIDHAGDGQVDTPLEVDLTQNP